MKRLFKKPWRLLEDKHGLKHDSAPNMSYSDEQLRGAILEEVILYLLHHSGYSPVNKARGDHTLKRGHSGLEVRGRGAWHQIDAIADFRITPPFANPIRLLVEAKCLGTNVGLPVIRNSTGVLKDVAENWVVDSSSTRLRQRSRYHYLMAVFSATAFTRPAQEYAFAHDVYLVPMAKSAYMAPLISVITAISAGSFAGIPLHEIRSFLRLKLIGERMEVVRRPTRGDGGDSAPQDTRRIDQKARSELDHLVTSCAALRFGAIAMFGGRFPAFLVAAPDVDIEQLPPINNIRVRWIEESWFLESDRGETLFSFDLPEEMFRLYVESRSFYREAAADMKGRFMSEFVAYHYNENNVLRVIQFRLDQRWYADVRENLGLRPDGFR